MYSIQEQKTKSFIIHDNQEVEISTFGMCNHDSRTRSVLPAYDPAKTTIIGAELYVKAFSTWTGVLGDYFINDEAAIHLEWRGPFAGGTWREDRKDVTTMLRFGAVNVFKAQACKVRFLILTIGVSYTAILTITYTGEDPGPVTPTTPAGWLEKYLPWIIVGAVGLATVGIVYTRKGGEYYTS